MGSGNGDNLARLDGNGGYRVCFVTQFREKFMKTDT